MRNLIQSTIRNLMALQFEQRRILANFCGGLALVITAHLIFVRPGFFNVIMAFIATVILLRIAVVLVQKGENDV